MTITPVATIVGNTIDCDGVDGSFQCKTMLPNYETRSVNFGIKNSGDLVFNPDSPENHKQSTMFDEEN